MSASRSCDCYFKNESNQVLFRTDFGLEHGIWSDDSSTVPPEKIAPNSTAHWASESDGFATGTQGWVDYSCEQGNIHANWDVPYIGDNGASIASPTGTTSTATIDQGDNVTANYTFKD